MTATKKTHRYVLLFILICLSAVVAFPLMVTVTNSFMSEAEITQNYSTNLSMFDALDNNPVNFINMNLIPSAVAPAQYAEVLVNQPSFLALMLNSIKITVPVVAGTILVSLASAFGFTVWQFKYKEVIFYVYIVVMLMPLQAVLVPNYIIARDLGILESYLAIILPGIFAPFGTFLLRQSMKSIPTPYFEAARIDGAGNMYIFWRIVMPQMKSGIAALAMLTFIEYWNIVEQSVIFIKDYYKEPLSVYLSRVGDGKMGLIFAASCVYMFLPLWFLALGQRDLEKGIELSGVK